MKSKTLAAVFVFAAALAAGARAQPAPPAAAQVAPAPPYGSPIGLDQARAVVARAELEARKRNAFVTFAVVEPSGRLVTLSKMDGANYSSIESAMKKATSAAVWRRSTSAFADALAQNRLIVLSLPEAYGSLGGEPLVIAGKVVGAIGVSGDPNEGEIAKIAAGSVR